LRYSLTDAPGEFSYPISGTVWALLDNDQSGNAAAADLIEFLRWATHEGQTYVKDLKYAPLPPELVKRIDDKLADVKLPAK
jgi:phosphate transport system substrate-binding protein